MPRMRMMDSRSSGRACYLLLSTTLLICLPVLLITICIYHVEGLGPFQDIWKQNNTSIVHTRTRRETSPNEATVPTQQVAITQAEGLTTFWFNSSNTHVATFMFDYCNIVACPAVLWQCSVYQGTSSTSIYICVTDSYWGQDCNSWGAVGWNTGLDWGYKPQSALKKMDRNGKSLISRMTLLKSGTCLKGGKTVANMKLTLNIENPNPGDAGMYVLGAWEKGGTRGNWGKFLLKDMFHSDEYESLRTPQNLLPSRVPFSRTQTFRDMVAIADPTFEDTMAIETGSSDTNFWLEWMRFNAHQHNKSNCYVCGQARPHLGTVPLNIPKEVEKCFLSLFTSTNTYHSKCEDWKIKYPMLTKHPKLTDDITIYPGDYTCYANYDGKGRFLGNFTDGYCANYSDIQHDLVQNQSQSLGDIYWICGDRKIRPRLEGTWTGQCALAKVIMPLHILADEPSEVAPAMSRKKRSILGSFDPHVYIDSIGVPRGVPDEFKARDQVKAGFESLIPIITINKNVDWINYIYYNQQRFINYTKDALKGIAEQLGPTSTMTFQNRMALDMILAEKGGVCKMLEGTGSCCTYIPDNTGPNGKVTLAIRKLEDLSEELKKNSGISNPWDQYFGWMKG